MVILRRKIAGLTEASLERFLHKTIKAAGLRPTVNVLITNSRELKNLNARYRGKDAPTDVLSFPPLSWLPEDFGGDIAISAEIAARNAKLLGHTAAEEIKILILHGVLHLAGHDHERDNGAMAREEQRLRRSLRLPIGLIERSANSHDKPMRASPAGSGVIGRRRQR